MSTRKELFRIILLGLALLSGFCLLASDRLALALAQDAGSIPDELVKALKDPLRDPLQILDLALEKGAELKGKKVSRSDAMTQLTADVTDFIAQIDDLEPNAQGKVVLSEPLEKVRDVIVNKVIVKLFGKLGEGDGTTPPEVVKTTDLKPSDRLKKQLLNINLYALQDVKDLRKDPKLGASEVREKLVAQVLEFATQVSDLDTGTPKGATDDEKKFLTNLCDEVIAGRVVRPKVGPQIGLSNQEQGQFHDILLVRGTELASKVKPDSDDYAKQLKPIAEDEFRKLAKLKTTDALSAPQVSFINSLVRQVKATVGINVTGLITTTPVGSSGALDAALRSLLLSLAKSLNKSLINAANSNTAAQAFLNAETRRATLVSFILGMIVKKRGLGGLSDLSEPERTEANAIAQEALADNSGNNGGGSNPTGMVPVITYPVMPQPFGPIFLYNGHHSKHHLFYPH